MRRFHRYRALALVALVLAGSTGAAVATRPTAGQALLVVSHQVRDVGAWRRVFDEAAEAKRRFGWIRSSVHTVDGEPDRVLVIEEFRTLGQARAFAALRELREGMERAGLVGEPVVHVVAP